ncbi:hypothetical protein QAD02_017023 [Eretmocerus hayati]|uniref:Uncharacterized protein n=1 Tax=Eretmocerus hayati TaxID=131215 RepID=A0ACC2PEL5_9HYME|nr:hypothetical protein QAD02_017023 [Eretmocerus hayati]
MLPGENMTEYLIEALINTTKHLKNLEVSGFSTNVKQSVKESIGNKRKQNQYRSRNNDSIKVKKNWYHLNPKSSAINVHEVTRRRSSKISVCSSSNSVTSEGDSYEKLVIPVPVQQSQDLKRCQSPSRFKYLVCQSERDVNYKGDIN